MVKFNIISQNKDSSYILGIKPDEWHQIGGDVSYSLYGCQIGRYNSNTDEFEVYNFIPLESDIETKYENPMIVEFASYELDELKSHKLEEFGIELINPDESVKLSLIASLLIQDNTLGTNETIYYEEEKENDIFPDFETAKKMTIGDDLALDFNGKEMDGLKRTRANKLIQNIKDFIITNIVYVKFDKNMNEYYRYALKFKNNRIAIDWETQKVETTIKKNGFICLIDNQIVANPKNHAEEHLLEKGFKNPEVIYKKPTKSSKTYAEKEDEMLKEFKLDLHETKNLIPIWNKRVPTEFSGNVYDFLGHLDTEITQGQNQIDKIKAKIETELNQTSKTKSFIKDIDKLKQDLTNLKNGIHSKYEIKSKKASKKSTKKTTSKKTSHEKEPKPQKSSSLKNTISSIEIPKEYVNFEGQRVNKIKRELLYDSKELTNSEKLTIYQDIHKGDSPEEFDPIPQENEDYSFIGNFLYPQSTINIGTYLIRNEKLGLGWIYTILNYENQFVGILAGEKLTLEEFIKKYESKLKKETKSEEKEEEKVLVFNRFRLTQKQNKLFEEIKKLRNEEGIDPRGLDMDLEMWIKQSKRESKNEQEEEEKLTEILQEKIKRFNKKPNVNAIKYFVDEISKDFDLGALDNFNGRDKHAIAGEVQDKFNIIVYSIIQNKEKIKKELIKDHPNVQFIDFTDKFDHSYSIAFELTHPKEDEKIEKLCPIWDNEETLPPKYAEKWVKNIKEPQLSYNLGDSVKLELKLKGIIGREIGNETIFDDSKTFNFKEIKPRKQINECFRDIDYTILSKKSAKELNLYPLTKENAKTIYIIEGTIKEIKKAVLEIYVTIQATKIYPKPISEEKPKKKTTKKKTTKKNSQEVKRERILKETQVIKESEKQEAENLSYVIIPNNLIDYQKTLMSASKIPLLKDVNVVEKALAKADDKLSEQDMNKAIKSWMPQYEFTENEMKEQYMELKLNEEQLSLLTDLGNDLVAITIRNTIKKKNSKPEDISKAVNLIYQYFGRIQLSNNLLLKNPNNKVDEIGKILVKNAGYIENQEYTILYDKSEKNIIGILLGKKVSQKRFNNALKQWLEKLKDEVIIEEEIMSSCYQLFIKNQSEDYELIGYYDNIDPLLNPSGEEDLFKQIGLEMFNKVEQDVCNLKLLSFPMNCYILSFKNEPIGNLYLMREIDDKLLNRIKNSIKNAKDWEIEEI